MPVVFERYANKNGIQYQKFGDAVIINCLVKGAPKLAYTEIEEWLDQHSNGDSYIVIEVDLEFGYSDLFVYFEDQALRALYLLSNAGAKWIRNFNMPAINT